MEPQAGGEEGAGEDERAKAPEEHSRRGRCPGGGFLFSAGAQAAPGDLDPTFSGDGKQTTDFGSVTAERRRSCARRTERSSRRAPTALTDPATSPWPATTPTGRSTRASPATASRDGLRAVQTAAPPAWRSRATARSSWSAEGGGHVDFALARYNPDGSLDTTFSGDGKQTTDFLGQASTSSERRGDPGRRQDRRGRRLADIAAALRSRPLQPRTARWTRASPATASR